MRDIVILGNRISALLSGAWLKKYHPDLSVLVVGPRGDKLPLVGESTVEGTFMFLEQLGLADYLREHQAPKYGLTFYYKISPDNPSDTHYSVHENVRKTRTVTANLNRAEFDGYVRGFCQSLGVEFDERKCTGVEVGSGRDNHVVRLEDDSSIPARWLIDATGRTMLLAKQLNLVGRLPLNPRSSFWFRLADYDRSAWLQGMTQLKPPQSDYDSFYCTHHFMGRGNWVWGIPIKSEHHDRVISVGVTWRPDILGREIRSVQDFLALMDEQHPSVARFVRSGTVLDTSTYRDYMRASSRVYSKERWFLLGDAAASVDPLYSTGMLFTTLAIQQIEVMIRRDREDQLREDFVDALDACYRTNLEGIQRRIDLQYEIMSDPYQAHLMMHWDTAEYMYVYLPLLAGGHLWNPAMLRRFLDQETGNKVRREDMLRSDLIQRASARLGARAHEKMRFLYHESTNYDFDPGHCDVTATMSKGLAFRRKLRWNILKDAGGSGLLEHGRMIFEDFIGSNALRMLGEKALLHS